MKEKNNRLVILEFPALNSKCMGKLRLSFWLSLFRSWYLAPGRAVLHCLVKVLFKTCHVERGLGGEHDHGDDQQQRVTGSQDTEFLGQVWHETALRRNKTSANKQPHLTQCFCKVTELLLFLITGAETLSLCHNIRSIAVFQFHLTHTCIPLWLDLCCQMWGLVFHGCNVSLRRAQGHQGCRLTKCRVRCHCLGNMKAIGSHFFIFFVTSTSFNVADIWLEVSILVIPC